MGKYLKAQIIFWASSAVYIVHANELMNVMWPMDGKVTMAIRM